jgi:hypothetical protein
MTISSQSDTLLFEFLLLSRLSRIESFQPFHRQQKHQIIFRQSTLLASSTPFDFSSPQEWDKFYQERRQSQNGAIIHASLNPAEVEWHDSIPLIDIAIAVPPDSTTAFH